MSTLTNTSQQNTNLKTTNQANSVGFLQENHGHNSAMRLMSFIALISAITFGGLTLIKPEIKDVGVQLTYSFLVAAFAPKAVQKFAENRVS